MTSSNRGTPLSLMRLRSGTGGENGSSLRLHESTGFAPHRVEFERLLPSRAGALLTPRRTVALGARRRPTPRRPAQPRFDHHASMSSPVRCLSRFDNADPARRPRSRFGQSRARCARPKGPSRAGVTVRSIVMATTRCDGHPRDAELRGAGRSPGAPALRMCRLRTEGYAEHVEALAAGSCYAVG